MTTVFRGTGISPGQASAPVYFRKVMPMCADPVFDPATEEARFLKALEEADRELLNFYNSFLEADPAFARVFQAHQMLLRDPLLLSTVRDFLSDARCAEYALKEAVHLLTEETLKESGSESAAFENDLADAAARISFYLSGNSDQAPESGRYIVYGEEIVLGQLVYHHERIAGLVVQRCDRLSHGAILARSYGIPVVAGITLPEDLEDGFFARIDGEAGTLTLEEGTEEPLEDSAESPVLPPGLLLYGNAGNLMEAIQAKLKNCTGIGLFRTEFLYLERSAPPSEDLLYLEYRRVLKAMENLPVTIRTADLRADKRPAFEGVSPEDLLTTQLRALYRAGEHGKLRILFPMIESHEEFIRLKETALSVKEALKKEYPDAAEEVPLGAMIETLDAVADVSKIAENADFLSIGTNDLCREIRENEGGAESERVVELLPEIARAARENGIPSVICGELAGDASLWPYYKEIGITAVSLQFR